MKGLSKLEELTDEVTKIVDAMVSAPTLTLYGFEDDDGDIVCLDEHGNTTGDASASPSSHTLFIGGPVYPHHHHHVQLLCSDLTAARKIAKANNYGVVRYMYQLVEDDE